MKKVLILAALTLGGFASAATTKEASNYVAKIAKGAELYPTSTPFCTSVAKESLRLFGSDHLRTYQYEAEGSSDMLPKFQIELFVGKFKDLKWVKAGWGEYNYRFLDFVGTPYTFVFDVQDSATYEEMGKRDTTAVCITVLK